MPFDQTKHDCPRRRAMFDVISTAQVAATLQHDLAGHLTVALAMPALLEDAPDKMAKALDATVAFEQAMKRLAEAFTGDPS